MKRYKHDGTGAIAEGIHASGKPFKVTLEDSQLSSIDESFLLSGKDWKEIKEKDYEITAFEKCGEIIPAKLYKDYLLRGDYEIYSVKRLTDNVEFKIGDEVKISTQSGSVQGKIETIGFGKDWEDKNCLEFFFTDKVKGHSWNYLHNLEKIERKPLFKTEDGVDIYEGDYYAFVRRVGKYFSEPLDDDFKLMEQSYAQASHVVEDKQYPGRYINFSTREAAAEYVFMNKPCLSVKDVLRTIGLNRYRPLEYWQVCSRHPTLANFVKSKLNQ